MRILKNTMLLISRFYETESIYFRTFLWNHLEWNSSFWYIPEKLRNWFVTCLSTWEKHFGKMVVDVWKRKTSSRIQVSCDTFKHIFTPFQIIENHVHFVCTSLKTQKNVSKIQVSWGTFQHFFTNEMHFACKHLKREKTASEHSSPVTSPFTSISNHLELNQIHFASTCLKKKKSARKHRSPEARFRFFSVHFKSFRMKCILLANFWKEKKRLQNTVLIWHVSTLFQSNSIHLCLVQKPVREWVVVKFITCESRDYLYF